uniref:Uncharacterized protein n=1 Tax=Anguilla anguilla TaxID=7936 RepID=A0A0E9XJY2_ANGAN
METHNILKFLCYTVGSMLLEAHFITLANVPVELKL